jgi:hypothetical protein
MGALEKRVRGSILPSHSSFTRSRRKKEVAGAIYMKREQMKEKKCEACVSDVS